MAKTTKSPATTELFREALAGVRGKTGRSSLYRWLKRNHDDFSETWREGSDWRAFAEGFAKFGLTDRTGKPPAPETARKTWLQVRRDVAKARARRDAPGAVAPGEIAPGVPLVTPAAASIPEASLEAGLSVSSAGADFPLRGSRPWREGGRRK